MLLKAFFLSSLAFTCSLLLAQKPDAAAIKVHEGVELHDKGEFKKAIKMYDEALDLDKDNALAMAEKAMTLNALGEFEKSAALCQEVILKHDKAREMPMVYVTYGNCMDQMGRPEASLRVYNEGLQVLPDLYMLHFNKGVTLFGMDSLNSAAMALQRSARLNPYHPGTQAVISGVLQRQGNKVPAVLALCRFLMLEPEGARAKTNFAQLQALTAGNVTTDKKGNTTFHLDADKMGLLEDTVIRENDFRLAETSMELIGSMSLAALITGALKEEGIKTAPPNPATNLIMQLELLSSTLMDVRAKNFGFYWDNHASWLIALTDAGHLETLCHIATLSSDDKDVAQWVEQNGPKVDAYYAWEKDYTARSLKDIVR